MNGNTLRTLEFERVQTLLVSLAGSAAGREQLTGLTPASDRRAVEAALDLTSEAVRLLQSPGKQPYHDLPDLSQILPVARVRGAQLEALALRAVASFVDIAHDIAFGIAAAGGAVVLAGRAAEVQDLTEIAAAIRRALLPTGEIADDASPRLFEIRRTLTRLKAQLYSVMDGYLRSKDASRLLQDKLVTTRNDRCVLLLRADQRGQIPGVIHGSSGSGQSLYVEPLPAMELNNDIVALSDQEREEIVRILTELTARVGARAADLEHAVSVMADLDAAQARARLAELMDAQRPEIVRGLELELLDARHPLLLPAVDAALGLSTRTRKEPVPVTLRVGFEQPVLVISGPNTGGKTVALKTIGLLALMAQCGLHVPAARGSRLPVFRKIFADIGDEQSISADLSTFSARLQALVEMTQGLELPALVLLDEVGSGTDPREGGPLGVAVVEYFRGVGAMVVATTHDGLMKAYAQATPGVACGSFGYHPETYAPTYRLSLGEPGRSLALEMAERLGLPAAVVADARSRLSASEAQAEALLKRLDQERVAVLQEREQLRSERALLAEALLQQRSTEHQLLAVKRREVETFVRDLRRRGEEAARRAAEAVHEAVRKVEESRHSAAKSGAAARVEALTAIRQAQEEILHDPSLGVAAALETVTVPVAVGSRARVRGLGVIGEVVSLSAQGQAELAVGGKRLRVRQAELEGVAGPARSQARSTHLTLARPERSSDGTPAQVNLVGARVDEALPRLDKALDDAALGERNELRVIHGFGEGKLRKAVAGFLEGHPHVAAFRLGGPSEGGAGATIVALKE